MIRFVILACCCLIATRISSAKPAAPCVANFTVNIDALPLDLFQELLITVKVLRQMEYADVLTERKLSTFWYDRRKKVQHSARHAIERAIDHLEQYIQPIKSCTNIIGAEWWIQDKEVTAGIDFHYDKDEGLASLKRRMKHPSVSTVTYLTSEGAPTVILRQITPDGNRNIPAIPSFGYISFPVTNMHITFSGSLQHGVLRSASPFYDGKQEPELLSSSTVNVEGNHADITSPTNMIPPRRVTFLVNWWSTRPLEPNSRVMSDAMALSLAQQVTDIQRLHRHHHNNQDERGNMLDKEINKLVENEQKDEGNMCQPLNNQQMGGQPYRNDDDKNYQCHDDETASFIPSIQPLARQQSMVTISNLHITKNNLSSLQQHKIVTPPEQLLFINLPMDLPAIAYALAQSFIKRKSPLLLPNAPTMMDDLLIKHNQTNDSSDHDDSSVRSNHNHTIHVHVPVYHVQWDDDQIFGGITVLDFSNHALVNYMHSISLPRALFFYHKHDQKGFVHLLSIVLPLIRKYVDEIQIYFCPYAQCIEYANKLGLTKSDLPRAVLDDPINGQKFIGTQSLRTMTSLDMEKFWSQVVIL